MKSKTKENTRLDTTKGKSDRLEIGQDSNIWPNQQVAFAQTRLFSRKWDE